MTDTCLCDSSGSCAGVKCSIAGMDSQVSLFTACAGAEQQLSR